MTRIAGICARDAGPYVRLAYHLTGRSLARLTGREPERIIEALQMYAHVPRCCAAMPGSSRPQPNRIESTRVCGR